MLRPELFVGALILLALGTAVTMALGPVPCRCHARTPSTFDRCTLETPSRCTLDLPWTDGAVPLEPGTTLPCITYALFPGYTTFHEPTMAEDHAWAAAVLVVGVLAAVAVSACKVARQTFHSSEYAPVPVI